MYRAKLAAPDWRTLKWLLIMIIIKIIGYADLHLLSNTWYATVISHKNDMRTQPHRLYYLYSSLDLKKSNRSGVKLTWEVLSCKTYQNYNHKSIRKEILFLSVNYNQNLKQSRTFYKESELLLVLHLSFTLIHMPILYFDLYNWSSATHILDIYI